MSEWPEGPLSLQTLAALLADPAQAAAAGVQFVTRLADDGRYARRGAEFCDPVAGFAAYRQAFQPLEQDYPPAIAVALGGAMVVGQGAVVTRDGRLIHDSVRAFVAAEVAPAGFAAAGDGLRLIPPARVMRVDRPALLLQAPWWRNYGHWLFDSAALLALMAGYARRHGLALVIGRQTDPALRAVVADTLAALLPEADVIERDETDALVFDALHYGAPVSVTPLFKQPDAIGLLRRALMPAVPARRRPIYVARPPGRRQLVNEAEVIGLCAARGIEVIRPEQHSLRAQAALFAAAPLIVGVKGAALANLMFAPADATAIVLAPRLWIDPIFWDLAGQLGQRYIDVIVEQAGSGPPDSDAPLVVDLAALARALDAARSGRPVPPIAAPATEFALPDLPGAEYRHCLRQIHSTLRPANYLEIGCLDGETLALAGCPAIGIDPAFKPRIAIGPEARALFLFQVESDAFFARYDPARLLGQAVALAFIDGLHRIENALRDFIHVERCCAADGVIVLHDCVPLDRFMACRDQGDAVTRARSRRPAFWTGDVWKMLPILARFRPDLEVTVFNAPPTGLVLVRGLDPANRTLEREYEGIVAAWREPADEAGLFRLVIGALGLRDTGTLGAWLEGR